MLNQPSDFDASSIRSISIRRHSWQMREQNRASALQLDFEEQFSIGSCKSDRRHQKHGLVDVWSEHAKARASERKHAVGGVERRYKVCHDGKRKCKVIVTVVPHEVVGRWSETFHVHLPSAYVIGKSAANLHRLQGSGQGKHIKVEPSKCEGVAGSTVTLSAFSKEQLTLLSTEFQAMARGMAKRLKKLNEKLASSSNGGKE